MGYFVNSTGGILNPKTTVTNKTGDVPSSTSDIPAKMSVRDGAWNEVASVSESGSPTFHLPSTDPASSGALYLDGTTVKYSVG